ncbi:MAG: S8 family serine peptidase [Oscillospiraceae bacterium]|nr:S8 family serine peptidase [Oscillospiraceae bacterium]
MPMDFKRNLRQICVCACLLMMSGVFALCVCFGKREDTTIVPTADYIVSLRDHDDVPFDVVKGEELRVLLRAGDVLWYEEDAPVPLLEAEDGSSYYEAYQWNLAVIGAQTAFDLGAAGQGIRVGVVDSGVNPHPDFRSRLLPGHNYIEGAKDPDDTADTFGHGTRVAGLIVGAGEHGCIGAAPMAEIVPLKCTDGQTVRVSALCQAIYGGIDDYGCRVLNLSLGIQTESTALAEAAAYAAEKNVVLVAGVGNGGRSALHYPAAYDTVIGVGAVDREGICYVRSNHNESVSLSAPGVDLRTTDMRGGYTTATGCSFAVPQVSAAAAVLLSIDDSLTPREIADLLCQSAADAGSEGWDEYYGYGILNLAGAVEQVADSPTDGPSCEFLPAEGSPASAVRNLTGGTLVCDYLLAEYTESGACGKVTSVRITVPPYGTTEIQVPSGNGSSMQTLVDPDTGVPLVPARKVP